MVESYRAGAKVRHRQVLALGTDPDVPTAIRREIGRLRRCLDALAAACPRRRVNHGRSPSEDGHR